jgi:hypothetical protein
VTGPQPRRRRVAADDPCERQAVEQFLYADLLTGLYRTSRAQCCWHSEQNQPPETIECLPLTGDYACEGDDWR